MERIGLRCNVTTALHNETMNRENIQNYVQTTIEMPIEKAKLLVDKFELLELSKNELLLTKNKIFKNTYILESGLVRSFTMDNEGNEVTQYLFTFLFYQ